MSDQAVTPALVVATTVHGPVALGARWILNPVSLATSIHVTLIWLEETPVAARLDGAAGGLRLAAPCAASAENTPRTKTASDRNRSTAPAIVRLLQKHSTFLDGMYDRVQAVVFPNFFVVFITS